MANKLELEDIKNISITITDFLNSQLGKENEGLIKGSIPKGLFFVLFLQKATNDAVQSLNKCTTESMREKYQALVNEIYNNYVNKIEVIKGKQE